MGESEAIALAKETRADYLLIDERKGSLVAQKLGVQTLGLLGVIALAKEQGQINEAKPLLVRLKKSGFWVSDKLIQRVLARLNE